MECKAQSEPGREQRRQDLIETLWNVKKGGVGKTTTADADLIETLWNVK